MPLGISKEDRECRESTTSRRRSSPSYGRLMYWFHRDDLLQTCSCGRRDRGDVLPLWTAHPLQADFELICMDGFSCKHPCGVLRTLVSVMCVAEERLL